MKQYGSSAHEYGFRNNLILRAGTPDIYSMIDGIFLPIECKKVKKKDGNSILSHSFTKIQKKRMRDLLKVSAYPIGLIFCGDEKRYILPLAIREDGNISMEEYLKLPIFDWMELKDAGTKSYQSRFNK